MAGNPETQSRVTAYRVPVAHCTKVLWLSRQMEVKSSLLPLTKPSAQGDLLAQGLHVRPAPALFPATMLPWTRLFPSLVLVSHLKSCLA